MNRCKQTYMEMGPIHIKNILDDLANNECNDEPIGIYIFDTGNSGIVLQRYLQKHNSFYGKQFIVKGYFDNDESKQGTMIDGVVITLPQVQLIDKHDYVFIASSIYGDEMEQQLRKAGLMESKIIPARDYLQNFLQQPETRALFNPDKKQCFYSMLADIEVARSNDREIGIFIFGVGLGGQTLFYHLVEYGKRQSGRFVVKSFLDNNREKQGTMLEGISVVVPQNITMNETDIVIIASAKYGSEMQKQLIDLGVRSEKIVLPGKWLEEIMGTHDEGVNKSENVAEREPCGDSPIQEIVKSRERSRSKKTILVLDHHVPFYDQDAGGRCTYQYLKLFLELGLHVIFAGDYHKHEPYTSELEQLGIHVLYGERHKKNFSRWLKENGKFIDYAYLNRPYVAQPVVDDIRNFSQAKIFYFAHDLHFLREYRQYQVERKPELLVSSEKTKRMEYEVFNKVDVIHVVGSYEQEYLQHDFPQKIIQNIPLFIMNDAQFANFNKNDFESTKDIMFVGGFNHTPNQDAMCWFINEILPLIVKKIPDIKLYIVGSNPNYSLRRIKSPHIVVTGFVTDEELKDYYKRIRLVVAPLRYGAGIKGKIIEAIFHRTPVVTTSIGAEGLPDIAGKIAVSDSEASFAEAVVKVYQDKYRWENQSVAAFCYAKQNFSRERAIGICLSDMVL